MHKILSKTRFNFFLLNFLIISCLWPVWSQAQTPCDSGMAGEYPCNNIDLLGHLSFNVLMGNVGRATDIWGWVSPTTGDEFAIMGLESGVAIANITDPSNPVEIGTIPIPVPNSGWTDIKVKGNYAYVVTEGNGHHIRIIDLMHLENPPMEGLDYLPTMGMVGDGSAHNIVIDEEMNYSVTVGTGEASGGLVFHDLSDPENPTKLGEFSADGYSHDAVCFIYKGEDVEHVGKEICIGLNTDTYTIVDVTDKANPIQLSRTPYDSSSYTHQGWVTDDHKFLFLNDELDERNHADVTKTTTFIFDISDLDNPSSEPYYKFRSTEGAIDHNLYIKGSYVYQANYKAGLRILDISNIEGDDPSVDLVREAAYFDVYPEGINDLGFNGSWSVYPYFKSGNVVVSSRERGMFIVEPNIEHFVVDLTSESVKTIDQNGTATYDLDVTSYGGFDGLVDLEVTNLPPGLVATFSPPSLVATDNVLLTITDTGFAPGGNYSLEIRGSTLDADIPTQKLRVGLKLNSTVLPVTWTAFSATAKSDHIQLDWTTAHEFNNKGFEIERQVNLGKEFKKIAWVDGKGDSSTERSYRFEDENVYVGHTYYYRIKQIDEDGTTTFSKVVSAQIGKVSPTIVLSPNPAQDFVDIKLTGRTMATPIQTEIITLDGKVHLTRTNLVGGSSFSLPLDGLAKGVYILKVQSDDVILTERLVIY